MLENTLINENWVHIPKPKIKELMNKYRHLRLISFVLNLLSRIYVRSNETGANAYQDICIYHPTYTISLFDSTKCIENNKKYLNTYTKKKYIIVWFMSSMRRSPRPQRTPHDPMYLMHDIARDELWCHSRQTEGIKWDSYMCYYYYAI